MEKDSDQLLCGTHWSEIISCPIVWLFSLNNNQNQNNSRLIKK